MILLIINIAYPILACIGIYFLNNRNKIGYLVFLVVEVMMFYIGIKTMQVGLMLMAFLYTCFNMHGYFKWNSMDKKQGH